MGEMAEWLLEREEFAELAAWFEGCGSQRRPIWTDINGREYWKWKDILDDHLCNIVRLLERRVGAKNVPQKWYKEVRKRGLNLWTGLTKVTVR